MAPREIGIGMLGYAFMGKAHANAWRKTPYICWPPPALPKLVAVAGRSRAGVEEAASRYGFGRASTDWREVIDDPAVEVVDNVGPNDAHAEPCIAAAEAGKHIICEKPLARDGAEARRMLEAVTEAGVKHACAFNYRFVPAIRLAKQLIDEGELGRIRHFRAQYLQDWLVDPGVPRLWRMDRAVSGSGALGDFSHIVDLARYLAGEPRRVGAVTTTFVKERPLPGRPDVLGPVDVDDAFVATVEYESGAIGFVEGSRYCPGRKNYEYVEVNGSEGSLWWNLEQLNDLHVYFRDERRPQTRGFHAVNVTDGDHPFMDRWWPPGHLLGWEDTFVNQAAAFLEAIAHDRSVGPHQATFEDGYRAAVVSDAILESARSGRRVDVVY